MVNGSSWKPRLSEAAPDVEIHADSTAAAQPGRFANRPGIVLSKGAETMNTELTEEVVNEMYG